MNSSELSQTTEIKSRQTGTVSPPSSGATGPITRAISKRRSHRHQWRIFECIAMLILDSLLVDAAFRLAYYLRYSLLLNSDFLINIRHNLLDDPTHSQDYFQQLDKFNSMRISIVIGLVLLFAIRGLYNVRLTGSWFRQAWKIAGSATMGVSFLITYYFVFQPSASSRLMVPFVWVASIVVVSIGRLIVSWAMGLLYRVGLGETRLLVVGSGRLSKMMMQHLSANPNLGYSIVGFLHDMNDEPSDFGRFKMLGTLDDLGLVIRSMQVDEVIIALPSNMHQEAIQSVRLCERLGASFKLVPDLYELSLSRIDMEAVEGIPLLSIKQASLNTFQRAVTRGVDILVSGIVLLLGLPLWIVIGLAIRLDSPGEIVYQQKRVGLSGKPFMVFKFRSMYKNADQVLAALLAKNEAQGPLFKMKSDPRITPIGRFLRRTSFDEFPQLLNVLKGDMSLVGPRPAIPREVALYEDWQRGRLAIKPGLTGLWQVRGRSDLSFDEGVLMDLYYIENWSLRLYFQVLFSTIPAVLFSRGAY